jgi:hypothetical protein
LRQRAFLDRNARQHPGKDDEERDGSADPAPAGESETGEDEKDAGVLGAETRHPRDRNDRRDEEPVRDRIIQQQRHDCQSG